MGTSYGTSKSAIAISVKVADKAGVPILQRVLKRIEFVIRDDAKRRNESVNYRGSVINLSLMTTASTLLGEDLKVAYKRGIVIVASAGNSDADACDVAPAKYKQVITVASTDVGYSEGRSSNWGRCVTISAAGVGIESAWIGRDDATKIITGTSQATARVAGFAATITSWEFSGAKTATPDHVLDRMKSNGNFYTLVGGGRSTNFLMNNGFWKGNPYSPYPGRQVPV